jgi:hypothetical protein
VNALILRDHLQHLLSDDERKTVRKKKKGVALCRPAAWNRRSMMTMMSQQFCSLLTAAVLAKDWKHIHNVENYSKYAKIINCS